MRKKNNPNLETRVYKYGLLAPTINAKLVSDQIYIGHQYQNELVAMERVEREHYRAARREASPEFADLEDRDAELTAEIREINAENKARRTRKEKPIDTARKRALAKERKPIRARLKEMRAELKLMTALKEISKESDKRRKIARKALRAKYSRERGLYWGTYIVREDAFSVACKSAKVDPSFKRWDGQGYIGAQIQRSPIDKDVGLAVEDLSHERSRVVQVDALPADQWRTRSGRRRARTTLRIRVGSDGRAPIWAEFPMLQHRPFPSGARLKSIQVNRRRVGRRDVWSADFTLSMEPAAVQKKRRSAPSCDAVGIDVGWRRLENGRLRIAVLADSNGKFAEICMPQSVEQRLRKARDIASIRDRKANDIRGVFADFWRGREMPDGIYAVAGPRRRAEEARSAPRFDLIKSKTRLRAVVRAWSRHRVPGDSAAFEAVEAWRRRDRHLLDYESGARRRAQATRREFFRLQARAIRDAHKTVIIEKLDLAQLIKRADPELRDMEPVQAARWLRVVVAPGMFLAEIAQVCLEVVKLPAHATSYRCHGCGTDGQWEEPWKLRQECHECGRSFDQDFNAAANILEWGLEASAQASAEASAEAAA